MRRFGWFLLPLLLIGCRNPPNNLPYPVTLTREGMGAIHAGGTFDIALLRGKLPGFELEKLSEVTSEMGQTIVRLKRNDQSVALIVSDTHGDTISRIIILSPLIKNARGVGINDILPPSERLQCIRDECRYTDEKTITYRLDPHTHIIREITLQSL